MSSSGDSEYTGASIYEAMYKAVSETTQPPGKEIVYDARLRKFVKLYEEKSLMQVLPEPREIFYLYTRIPGERKSIHGFLKWFEEEYEDTYIWE